MERSGEVNQVGDHYKQKQEPEVINMIWVFIVFINPYTIVFTCH